MTSKIILIGILTFLLNLNIRRNEVFTAVADIKKLMEPEAILIHNIEAYIEAEQKKLNLLAKKLSTMQWNNYKAKSNMTDFLTFPVNSYLLIKRITVDWGKIKRLMLLRPGTEFLKNITKFQEIVTFPTQEDLKLAVQELLRIQELYNLNVAVIASGKYGPEMSWSDCFEIGRQLLKSDNIEDVKLWMLEALYRFDNERFPSSISKADILEFLSFIYYKEGDTLTALHLTQNLMKLSPRNKRAFKNRDHYESELLELKTDNENQLFQDHAEREELDESDFIQTRTACDGFSLQSPLELRRLRCRYLTNNNPFLKIAPFKVEEAKLDPLILIYRDVLYDSEIEYAKSITPPLPLISAYENPDDDDMAAEMTASKYQVSKASFLKIDSDPIIGKILKRTQDMTNLAIHVAGQFQIANYGDRRHYEIHRNMFNDLLLYRNKKKWNSTIQFGNRMASLIFYMNDVESGGETVFPRANTVVPPRKGSAIFWYNLHKSGERDYRTILTSCPVLTDYKWVMTFWIHEGGQEFRRPCDVKPDHIR